MYFIIPLLLSKAGGDSNKAVMCSKLSGTHLDTGFALRAMFRQSPATTWLIVTAICVCML